MGQVSKVFPPVYALLCLLIEPGFTLEDEEK